MADEPKRFETGTVLYRVNDWGRVRKYRVVSQRGSTLTAHQRSGTIEMPDGSTEQVVHQEKVHVDQLDNNREWFTDERKAVMASIRAMKSILTYAKHLPELIREKEERLSKLGKGK